jgi:predicted nucleotide-binding protein
MPEATTGDQYEFVGGTFHHAAIGRDAGHRGQLLEVPVSDPGRGVAATVPFSRKVFVVQGRDTSANRAMERFLRMLDLQPLNWEAMVTATGNAAPHVMDVVRQGFIEAAAVVVLLTPDDFAYLHESLYQDDDRADMRAVGGQPRANVLVEAGMAVALHPHRTVFVQIGHIRGFTDMDGVDFIRIDGSTSKLNTIARRLEVAGCAVDRSGTAWLDDDPFRGLAAHGRTG